MYKEQMARMLPETPPEGLVEWAEKTHGEKELGGEFCVFTSERWQYENGGSGWVARCTCTACLDDFITQKEPGEKAIRLYCGDDGSYYTVDPETEVDPYMGIEIQREGDDFYCPICGNKVELIHRSSIVGGRTKRIMVISVQNVQGYTSLIYWLVQRHLDEDGESTYDATPEEAYVLTEHGGLVRYSHVHRLGAFYGANRSFLQEWKLMSNCTDVIDKCYPDWRSINNKKCGADIWPVFPDLEGSTGEKTALTEFLKADGFPVVPYLKLWRRFPAVENLCRQGQAKIVSQIIREAYRFSYSPEMEAKKYLDLSKKRPHEMLDVSKEEFRWLRSNGLEITITTLELWRQYRKQCGKLKFDQFAEMAAGTGVVNMRTALELMQSDGTDLDKIKRYLDKAGDGLRDAGTLKDARTALVQLYNRALTQEEMWPRNLHEVHDRAFRMIREREQEKEATKLRQGFEKVLESYGCLQWNDGDLAVILPKNNGELVREGDVLRHCVGGYGKQHCEGTSVIFFIRHYRRPERPYYTLAINMNGKPRRCQLHGYGNERHGKYKEHTHSIPKKVKDFCNKWENDVLLAWYAEQQRKAKEKTA